ncbi:hypothetical protein K7472_07770 [Streptomyces sp. PTM05]|uniref:Uncharacterized protein n=1 Tax=Streptantibioticus parmotrematis TaxID=2873249 RepID=A0ABS7QNJ6_9ACTN|nr:hypothetical protein [Streptantibioticus parmotrematis]MBY8884742.1 hypothetical protein [Streptantibioticus parmotrematis]
MSLDRALPSGRCNPAQQIKVVIALTELLEDGGARVDRALLAERVGRSFATVGDCMTFLTNLGLVKTERGRYGITEDGRRFARLWPRDTSQARLVLRPLAAAHWSAAAAAHHLADGPMPQEQLGALLRSGLPGVPLRGSTSWSGW